MTRESTNDFASLVSFIEEFNLSNIAKDPRIIDKMKPMHKKLFALMTFVTELEQKNTESNLLSPDGLNYLKESVSDLGQTLFCWFQGAYKPANLILRSSIETFVRAIAGQETAEIYAEKNMYKVFEMAECTSYFNSEMCKDYFNSIYSTYKDLCKIVHTGSFESMAHISALKTFPLFSTEDAKIVCREFIKISTMMLSVIYVNFYQFIHIMHPKNQNNFICSIPQATKRKIHENIGVRDLNRV